MPLLVAVMRLAATGQSLPRQVLTYEKISGGAVSTALAAGSQNVVVKVTNTEAAAGRIAWGTTPDATATAQTSDTTAGMPIGAGESEFIHMESGEKISFATTT